MRHGQRFWLAILGGLALTSTSLAEEGTRPVDLAIGRAADWLISHQSPDGSWKSRDFACSSGAPPCSGRGHPHLDRALTGLSVRALLVAGVPPNRAEVERALAWLAAAPDPARPESEEGFARLLTALALVEARARDPVSVSAGRAGAAFEAVLADLTTRRADDCEVGWLVALARKSAALGFELPERFEERLRDDLAFAAANDGAATLAPVAIHARCWPGDTPPDGLGLPAVLPEPGDPEGDLFSVLFAGQLGGPDWRERWKAALLASQRTDGCERGSWDPVDRWGGQGGRLYSTATAMLVLDDLTPGE